MDSDYNLSGEGAIGRQFLFDNDEYHSSKSRIHDGAVLELEEKMIGFQKEKEEALRRNVDLVKCMEEVKSERDLLRDEVNAIRVCVEEREVGFFREIHDVGNEVEVYRFRIKELEVEKEGIRICLEEQEIEFFKQIHEVRNEAEVYRSRVEELEGEKERIRVCMEEKEEEYAKSMEEVRNEVDICRERIEELESERRETLGVFGKCLDSVRAMKDCLVKVTESIDEEKMGNFTFVEEVEVVIEGLELHKESKDFLEGLLDITKMVKALEMKVSEFQGARKKEKRELENSVVSLTEENRDINSLLRIALVEKEAVEKSLNKLKGTGEQKRMPLLQRVGFGFIMGNPANEQALENSMATSVSSKSDGSECEEEGVSLASTVERIMKNLRAEITQLRRSLDESRSENERLQSLTEKQAQTIGDNALYIKELEDRERVLAENVEELLVEIKETEEEVVRWREACELEVEAGKKVIEEREKLGLILQQELEKTKAALEVSNSKLKLKEDLAVAAMAAQAAAERSLQLADSRASGLRERIEELTRQLEEVEGKDRNRHKVRHICWPWRLFRLNPVDTTNPRVHNVKRMLPEMQTLLHHNV